MTVQDEIDEVLALVENGLKEELPQGIKDMIINRVENLGFEWKHANAHVKALCICAGMTGHADDEEYDLEDKDQMRKLEEEGSGILMSQVGLATYCMMVEELT